jgi:hypothetical protein
MKNNLTSIKIFLTDDEKEKVNQILKHLNSKDYVLSGKERIWEEKDVYELLLGRAIKNYEFD